jgi:hypothetical protein
MSVKLIFIIEKAVIGEEGYEYNVYNSNGGFLVCPKVNNYIFLS